MIKGSLIPQSRFLFMLRDVGSSEIFWTSETVVFSQPPYTHKSQEPGNFLQPEMIWLWNNTTAASCFQGAIRATEPALSHKSGINWSKIKREVHKGFKERLFPCEDSQTVEQGPVMLGRLSPWHFSRFNWIKL